MKVKITSDSTCDLSKELVHKYNIDIIPLHLTCGGKVFTDGVDISPAQLFEMTKDGSTCATAAVSPQEYLDFFGELLKENDAIVHFTISSSMSCCYQNACLAAEELGNVYVIDSENLSTGIGLLVLRACEMAQSGMDAADIKAAIDEKRKLVDASFVLDTLEYLRRGGRCSAIAALGANLLKLKPCIQVGGGSMSPGKKYNGALKGAILRYVKDRLADPTTIDDSRIFITDSGVSEDIRGAVEEAVLACIPFKEVLHTQAGCTVSGHCGPNTLGILFMHKEAK